MDVDDASTAANVPPELLNRIFGHCERRHRYIPADGSQLLPKSRLQPLLLVCRRWHTVAERRLYSSVSLGSNRVVKGRNGQRMEINGKDVCRRLCETVQNNARIASLVRELQMGSYSAEETEESEMHVRLIGICKNVEKIGIHGCHPDLLDDLAAALAKADLISLDLSRERLGGYPGESGDESMFSISTVIGLLQNLPRLQHLYANLAKFEYSPCHESPLARAPFVSGSCAALKAISIHGQIFTSTQLHQLAETSPHIEDLSIKIGENCNVSLKQCLEIWSSSLRRLVVFTPTYGYYGKPFPDDDCPVIHNPMIELQELWMPAPLVTPSAMALLPKLEKLNFRGDYSHGTDFVQVLRKGAMPNVREIDASFSPPKPSNGSERSERDDDFEFEIAKELRRVCKERKVFFRDYFTEVEELEEYYGYPEETPESSDNDWWDYDDAVEANAKGDEIDVLW
ncbi:hypothetical protein SCHPADRAFT_936852 [Schizopora paradoxa]|uniref:F-box domain-containing protein n=1 Tax=Schizopora paradoxa TaxID=27342 RepID=A0A0H2S0W9_9AGAM|nr:hypothetical protein SCHPADRAFT_936852 [Schizopora paradoxa]